MRRALIRRLAVLTVVVLAVLAFASPTWAATLTVTKTADTNDGVCDSDCSLREAVQRANTNGLVDTVNFAPGVAGTITLTAGGGISILDDSLITDLTINGPGSDVLAVSGNNATRPFGIDSGARAIINGLTIRNGKGDVNAGGFTRFGGGIFNRGTLTLNDATVSNNKGEYSGSGVSDFGAGIYNDGGTVTLNDSTVNDNLAYYGQGGGIYNDDGAVTLNDSTISNNQSGFGSGGGIFNAGGPLTLNRSNVSGNKADLAKGGGIYSYQSTVTLNDSTVSNNTAPDFSGAGGIESIEDTLTLNGSTVSNNTGNEGGGVSNYHGTLTLNESTVSGNTAEFDGGGGIYSETTLGDASATTTTIKNSTVSGNVANNPIGQVARDRGGGVLNVGGLTRIENSTITNNSAPAGQGSGVASSGRDFFTRTEIFSTIVSANANDDDVQLVGGSTNTLDSNGYNLVGGGVTSAFNQTGDQTSTTNPGLGPLQDNGGLTQTHALLTGSPAIDTGTNTGCPSTDQRGGTRPTDGDGNGEATCDVGSFERETASPPDGDGDGVPDSSDACPDEPADTADGCPPPQDRAPVAKNDFYRAREDKTLNVPTPGVLGNDTDADGDALTASVISGPKTGKLTLDADGSFTYKPKRNLNGTVSFVYETGDGNGGLDNATVSIRIKARPG